MKVWKTAPCDENTALRVGKELSLHPALARVLVARGLTEKADIERFLNPRLSDISDPFLLPGMEKAVKRIAQAVDGGEPVVVFGDYDADGVSSTALMVQVLTRLGAAVTPFLPHRIEDGYGLGTDTLKRCLQQHKPKLVVTVDCGTGSVEAVEAARAEGVDVVVTDHHEPSGDVARAVAVVNPKLGSVEGAKVLAGVGVAFKLCHALVKQARARGGSKAGSIDLRDYLDLVGIGTIADVVPLIAENRILARHGLGVLNRTKSTGLKALIEVAGIAGPLDTYHVGFLLGPRLNAAGRLGDAQAALELLLTADVARARSLASQLDASNRERQSVEAKIVDEAMEEIDKTFKPSEDFALVVARRDWHPGVIGIVASRLVARYRRPAVVIALDESGMGRGSGRSIEGFNMIERLGQCTDLLLDFGGHTMAAGLDIKGEAVDAFRERLNRVAAEALAGADLRPVQPVDAWLGLDDVDKRFLEDLGRLRPFGLGNPTPVWAVRGVRVVGEPRIVGNGHLKMNVAAGADQREAIGFGLGEREIPEGELDLAFHLQMNRYMGRETLQLSIQDFRPSRGDADG